MHVTRVPSAGDILDSILKGHGAKTALDDLVAGSKAIKRQMLGDEPKDSAVRRLDRDPRNSAKHMDVRVPGDWSGRMYPHNAKQAAFDAIDLALDNLYRLIRMEAFDVPNCAIRWDGERPARPQ